MISRFYYLAWHNATKVIYGASVPESLAHHEMRLLFLL